VRRRRDAVIKCVAAFVLFYMCKTALMSKVGIGPTIHVLTTGFQKPMKLDGEKMTKISDIQ